WHRARRPTPSAPPRRGEKTGSARPCVGTAPDNSPAPARPHRARWRGTPADKPPHGGSDKDCRAWRSPCPSRSEKNAGSAAGRYGCTSAPDRLRLNPRRTPPEPHGCPAPSFSCVPEDLDFLDHDGSAGTV